MDHAGWLQEQLTRQKKSILQRKLTKKEQGYANEGCGWAAAPDVLNDFERRAINMIGTVGSGIYNAPIAWNRVYWASDRRAIGFPWRYGHELATWDFNQLTMLVLLCHEARIRGSIGPGMRELQISLHERTHIKNPKPNKWDDYGHIHPNLEEVVKYFRYCKPLNHPITYPGDVPADEPAKVEAA